MNPSGQDNVLGTANVKTLLRQLAIPAITAQVVNVLYNVVDRMYIGHIPDIGALALTGVGVCMPIIMLITAFAALVSMGSAPRASVLMGRSDNEEAHYTLGNSFIMLIIIALVLTVFFRRFAEPILMAFGASENTIGYAMDYMRIYTLGTIFVQFALGLNAFITAQGFAKISMATVVIGAVINIVLDPIFIFGFHMGVKGAALATILSQAVSAIWVLRFLTGKKTILKLQKKYFRLRGSVVGPCLLLGMSPFIMQATESAISVCFNSSLYRYGGDIAVGAMTILTSVMMFAMLPLQGLGQGAQPIISYNYGARRPERVKKTIRLAVCYAEGIMVLGFCIFEFFPGQVLGLFSASQAMLTIGIPAMRIICLHFLLAGTSIVLSSVFQALGNGLFSLIVSVCRQLFVLLPAAWLLAQTGNVNNVWWAFLIAEIVSVLMSLAFYAHINKTIIVPLCGPAEP